jgi:uncharacterized protein
MIMATLKCDTKTQTVLSLLRKQLEQQYQERLDRVILFGSQARGEATEDSDIDVLIVLDDPVNASLEIRQTSEFVAQLCLEHNVLISRFFMARPLRQRRSRSRFETENTPLLRNIRREGILLLTLSNSSANLCR